LGAVLDGPALLIFDDFDGFHGASLLSGVRRKPIRTSDRCALMSYEEKHRPGRQSGGHGPGRRNPGVVEQPRTSA
jgi:hypothetical protein